MKKSISGKKTKIYNTNDISIDILLISIFTMIAAVFHIFSSIYSKDEDQKFNMSIISGFFWFCGGFTALFFL